MNREQRRRELTHGGKATGLYGATRFYVVRLPNGKSALCDRRLTPSDKPIELLDHEVSKYTFVNPEYSHPPKVKRETFSFKP